MQRTALALCLLATAALPFSSCGGGDESSSTSTPSTTTGTAGEDTAAEDDVFVGAIEAAPAEGGVLVHSLEIGSPVEGAGVRAGDLIVAVDGTPIETTDDLVEAIAGLGVTFDGGDQVELGVVRGGKEKALTLTLGGNVYLGAELRDAPQGGALVVSVPKAGPADKAGMEPHDVIVAVDGEVVAEVDDLLVALAGHLYGDEVEIEVTRGTRERTLTAILARRNYGVVKARPGPPGGP